MMEGHRGAKGVAGVMPALRSMFYEIASTTSAPALRSLQELADPARILWGSDLPFVYGDRLREEVEHWEQYDGFDREARSAIEESNALRLFPRFARAGSHFDSQNRPRSGGAE
jgi:predicted TIM-barrel fold metal-dependent hydrolase